MTTGTTIMAKVTQVATGVAGAPYYLTGYFDGLVGTAQQQADAWRAFLSAGVSTYGAGLVFSSITEVQDIDPTNGNLVAQHTVSVAAVSFTGASDPLPQACQGLARWRTGEYVGGREIRGRTNIPRLTEADSTLGVPSPSFISVWQARQAALLATATARLVVYSPKNGLWALVTSASIWGQWAVLRSRR